MLLAQTYFLLMLSILISYPSGIRHHQLKKVCIQTQKQECMSWNTLNRMTGQLWEMLYFCNRLEPSLILSLILEQMPTSNWPKKQTWSLVWNFGWKSIPKKNSFMHWNNHILLNCHKFHIQSATYTQHKTDCFTGQDISDSVSCLYFREHFEEAMKFAHLSMSDQDTRHLRDLLLSILIYLCLYFLLDFVITDYMCPSTYNLFINLFSSSTDITFTMANPSGAPPQGPIDILTAILWP
jgi:hypothetical protein